MLEYSLKGDILLTFDNLCKLLVFMVVEENVQEVKVQRKQKLPATFHSRVTYLKAVIRWFGSGNCFIFLCTLSYMVFEC